MRLFLIDVKIYTHICMEIYAVNYKTTGIEIYVVNYKTTGIDVLGIRRPIRK